MVVHAIGNERGPGGHRAHLPAPRQSVSRHLLHYGQGNPRYRCSGHEIFDLTVKIVCGTSGSATHILAGINDHPIFQGQTPHGFLNPRLYCSGLGDLNDITTYNTNGFFAIAGRDPVGSVWQSCASSLSATAGRAPQVMGLRTPSFEWLRNLLHDQRSP
ncbi:hypothetical protein V8E53_006728 [Lactarius tabidus]